ncbi:MAG: hypothetical protein ABFD04_04175 [Syntrophomonas sp.]
MASPVTLQTTAHLSFEQEPAGIRMSGDEQFLVYFRSAEITVYSMAELTTPLYKLKAPSRIIQGVAFSPDGRLLAAATDDNQVGLWSLPSGEWMQVVDGRLNKQGFFKGMFGLSHNQVVFSPDGQFLAALDNKARPVIWETKKYSICSHMDEEVGDAGAHLMDFSPDSQMLVVAHPHATILYHSQTGIRIERFKAAGKCLAFHHSEKQFAVGLKNSVKLFDPDIEEAEFCGNANDGVNSIHQVMFNSDGRFLLAAGRAIGASPKSDVLYAWSLAEGLPLPLVYPDKWPTNLVYKIHLIGPDKIALVSKGSKQAVVMHLVFPD